MPLFTDPSCLDSSTLGLLVSLRLIVYHFMSSSLIWYPLVHLAHFLFSPISPMSLPLDSSHFLFYLILSHIILFHLISSQLFSSCHLTSCLDTSSVFIFSPLLSSSHIIRSHLNSSQAFFLLIWSLLFQCLCFVFVLSCPVSNVQSSSRLPAFPYFLAYFLLCHLLSCLLSTFYIIPCLLLSSHLLYLLLSRFLSLHLASSCFVSSQFYSSPCLLTFSCFMSFCPPLSCLPVNKSCSSLRSLCPGFSVPVDFESAKVQNCHCLQTVLCITPPCQHSFFGLNLASLYFLSPPGLASSLSLSLSTSPSSQLASTLPPASFPNNARHKSLSISTPCKSSILISFHN